MKTIIVTLPLFLILFGTNALAQEPNTNTNNNSSTHEKYGKTLNLGAGVGYYRYVGQPIPVGIINFEFDVVKNFTLAPFIGFYSYQRNYYWGNKDIPYRYYSYRTIVVPVGVKGTYYFDELFHANSKWDFYAGSSIGFAFRNSVWENGYYGEQSVTNTASPLYLDAHIGAEYHMTSRAGLFLDLSTGVSTFGLALHF